MSGRNKKNTITQSKKKSSFFESVAWINVFFLFAYAFIPVFTPNLSAFDSNGPKFLTFSILNLLALLYLLSIKYKKRENLDFLRFFKTKLGIIYTVLLLLSLFSFISSINVIESVVHFSKIFTTFSATFIIVYFLQVDKKLFQIFVLGMTCLLIFDSIQVFVGIYHFIIRDLKDIDLIKAGYSNKNILSAALFIKLPFAISLIYFQSGWVKKIGFLGVFFGMLSILMMSSRAFYIGLIAISFFYVVFLVLRHSSANDPFELRKAIPFLFSLLLAFVVFSTVQKFFYPKIESKYNEDFTGRLATISVEEGGGYRLISWGQTANLIKESPLLGVGLGNWKIAVLEEENRAKPNFTYHLKAHNDFLEITAEVGILGLVCFLSIFFISFYHFLIYVLGKKFTERLDLLFLSSFGLLAYSFDAFFNFPQDRPEIQALFAVYLAMSIVVSPIITKNSVTIPVGEHSKITGTSVNSYSKGFLVLLLGIGLASSWILYLNFKSLKIQLVLKEEQVSGKSFLNSSFLLENFPAIPNLSSSSDPINGLIAKKFIDEKNYEEAITLLKKTNPNPFDGRREFYMAYSYFNLNELDSAEYYIKFANSLKPLHFLFVKFYANIKEKKGEKREAIAILDNYLSKYKKEVDAWKYSASLYHEAGNQEKVMELMDSANFYFPVNEEIVKLKQFYTYAYYIPDYQNASNYFNEGKYAKAVPFFSESYPAFEKFGSPDQLPEFLNSWAFSLLQTNQINRSKEIFRKVVDKFPNNYFALKNLGFIAFQYEKKYPQAIDYYQRSLKAENPDYFQSHMNLGTIYLIQNQKDLAITHYENSLSYGKSEVILKNLYLLWKEKGDLKKSQFYFSQFN